MLSKSLKNRYIKESSSNIHTIKEPMFSYLIDLYGESEKLKHFEKLIEIMNGENGYFNYGDKLINEVVQFIKTQSEYLQFANCKLNEYKADTIKCKNFYSDKYVNKFYISIDLKEGGFQALKFMNVNLFNCNKFEDFIAYFALNKWFWKSKQLRQVILGQLNPSRQQTIINYMMSSIKNFIEPTVEKYNGKIIKCYGDEIIIQNDSLNSIGYVFNYLTKILINLKFNLHVDLFELKKIKTNYGNFYKKCFYDSADIINEKITTKVKDWSLHSVNKTYYPQLFNLITVGKITDLDLYFESDKILCKFVEPLKILK